MSPEVAVDFPCIGAKVTMAADFWCVLTLIYVHRRAANLYVRATIQNAPLWV